MATALIKGVSEAFNGGKIQPTGRIPLSTIYIDEF